MTEPSAPRVSPRPEWEPIIEQAMAHLRTGTPDDKVIRWVLECALDSATRDARRERDAALAEVATLREALKLAAPLAIAQWKSNANLYGTMEISREERDGWERRVATVEAALSAPASREPQP